MVRFLVGGSRCGDGTLKPGDGGGGGERDFALGARGASRFAFMLMYLFFVLVSLVLLINYLIAMLSDTHASQKMAELTRRVTFARRVLRMDCSRHVLHFGPTNAGSPHPEKKGKWVHTFTVCSTNAEGISGLGGKISSTISSPTPTAAAWAPASNQRRPSVAPPPASAAERREDPRKRSAG